ncbi:MAG: bacillithiol system redox-active protein YtxJ [Brumimicrobium sp.]|nr:bacillithiol system redox-active protein YtxJ [Brumimicrobium sp.]
MGLFTTNTESNINWIEIQSIEDLEKAFQSTQEKPGIFFKHSTRCPVSRAALNRFNSGWKETEEVNLYYIDLLKHRDVSNAITEKTNVVHQSPQAILLKNNTVLLDEDHGAINAEDFQNLV